MTNRMIQLHEKEILDVFLELPPEGLITNPTSDQETHIKETKKKFNVLHSFFDAHFSGLPIPLETLEGNSRDFFEAKFYYFLALYDLIQYGWKYLIQYSENPFSSPGEYFIQILSDTATAQVHKCTLGRYDDRPRHDNEMRRLANKIEQGKLKPGKPGENQIKKYRSYIKILVNAGFLDFAKLEIRCVAICEKHSQGNKRLNNILNRYYKERQEVENITKRIDTKRNAYAWQDGERLHSDRKGGTYRNSS